MPFHLVRNSDFRGVFRGSRDGNGQLIHDDWLISAALAAALENETLVAFSPTHIISAADPLHEMDSSYEPKA